MVAANKRTVAVPMRQRILDEAERLIAVKGVYGFTLQDIAAPLGVRVPAIYKHYRNRDGVLIEVSRPGGIRGKLKLSREVQTQLSTHRGVRDICQDVPHRLVGASQCSLVQGYCDGSLLGVNHTGVQQLHWAD